MKLITSDGVRVDRPLTDLDRLLLIATMTPYQSMTDQEKRKLKLLLQLDHLEREQIRFAPISYVE